MAKQNEKIIETVSEAEEIDKKPHSKKEETSAESILLSAEKRNGYVEKISRLSNEEAETVAQDMPDLVKNRANNTANELLTKTESASDDYTDEIDPDAAAEMEAKHQKFREELQSEKDGFLADLDAVLKSEKPQEAANELVQKLDGSSGVIAKKLHPDHPAKQAMFEAQDGSKETNATENNARPRVDNGKGHGKVVITESKGTTHVEKVIHKTNRERGWNGETENKNADAKQNKQPETERKVDTADTTQQTVETPEKTPEPTPEANQEPQAEATEQKNILELPKEQLMAMVTDVAEYLDRMPAKNRTSKAVKAENLAIINKLVSDPDLSQDKVFNTIQKIRLLGSNASKTEILNNIIDMQLKNRKARIQEITKKTGGAFYENEDGNKLINETAKLKALRNGEADSFEEQQVAYANAMGVELAKNKKETEVAPEVAPEVESSEPVASEAPEESKAEATETVTTLELPKDELKTMISDVKQFVENMPAKNTVSKNEKVRKLALCDKLTKDQKLDQEQTFNTIAKILNIENNTGKVLHKIIEIRTDRIDAEMSKIIKKTGGMPFKNEKYQDLGIENGKLKALLLKTDEANNDNLLERYAKLNDLKLEKKEAKAKAKATAKAEKDAGDAKPNKQVTAGGVSMGRRFGEAHKPGAHISDIGQMGVGNRHHIGQTKDAFTGTRAYEAGRTIEADSNASVDSAASKSKTAMKPENKAEQAKENEESKKINKAEMSAEMGELKLNKYEILDIAKALVEHFDLIAEGSGTLTKNQEKAAALLKKVKGGAQQEEFLFELQKLVGGTNEVNVLDKAIGKIVQTAETESNKLNGKIFKGRDVKKNIANYKARIKRFNILRDKVNQKDTGELVTAKS